MNNITTITLDIYYETAKELRIKLTQDNVLDERAEYFTNILNKTDIIAQEFSEIDEVGMLILLSLFIRGIITGKDKEIFEMAKDKIISIKENDSFHNELKTDSPKN